MKKYLFGALLIILVIFLSGCQKKSSVKTQSVDTLPAELENLNSNSATSPKPSGQSAGNQGSFVKEKTSVDETFLSNYQVALSDAQRALVGKARYCGTIVKFYGPELTPSSSQSFVFYSDEFSKDYYWFVELNGYEENRKIRSFTARKDVTSDIKCFVAPPASPTSFSGFYEQFTSTDKFKLIDPGIIAQTIISTMDTGWSVRVIDNAGALAASEIMNSSSNSAPVTTTVTVTP